MNAWAIRNWLIITPRPTMVKIKVGNVTHDFAIDRRQSWSAIGQSIAAMSPDAIEAYDDQNKLLRAAVAENLEAEPEPEEPSKQSSSTKVVLDAETERFKVFTDHLAQAYRFANETAFSRMVDLFAAVNRRSEALEKSLDTMHRLLNRSYQEQLDQALANAENADPVSDLVGAFVSGAVQGKAEAPRGTNGKGAKS